MSSTAKNTNQSRPSANQLKDLYWQARNPPKDPQTSYKDKTVLVTGANTGIGYHAAVKFAALGASPLIIAVRTQEKGEATKAAIIRETGNENIVVIPVDLSTFDAVKEFAAKLNEQVPKLDVALLNAGLAMPSFTKGPGEYEIGLQVNVFSTALMALLILPKLRETAAANAIPSHLTFTTSKGYQDVEESWLESDKTLIDQLNSKEGWFDQRHYLMVKLATMFALQGVADRHSDNQVIINAACPGFCKTDLGRNFSLVSKICMGPIQYFVARTAEQGSRSLVSATTLGPESIGKLWHDDKVLEPSTLQVSKRGSELYRETWGQILTILRKHIPSKDV
ncbi:Short-chain dehydrogenase/reductase SDR [Penicillium fimorum]|uniref:Short-chain dehydrogenase/reductase SDR n=1 Tax=Penicillium fimorum TaxID=1882269 RepID=A0A9X0C1P4_9EURO|nr:Short-chain dehydrogenase/reductase SDR [Penicillium fimorum]